MYIKNFGPIKEAEIEVKSVLVLIGEQASGKSTVAKERQNNNYEN